MGALALLWLFVAKLGLAAPELQYHDIRYMGTDLVDELVFDWSQAPPLPGETGLVLIELDAPVGLDDRFSAAVENRLYELLQANPNVPIYLIHCAACRRWLARSTPQGTVITRGSDEPEVIANLGAKGKMGLSLHFEAQARDLVLRAEIFELTDKRRIVWAKRLNTSMSSRQVLQEATPLKSLAMARLEQQKLLDHQDPLEVVTRATIRVYSPKGAQATAPLLFVEQSLEAVPAPLRRMRAAATIGFTSIRDSLEAWSAGGHIAYLLFRETPSFVDPDLYWFLGFHYTRLRGPGAAVFADKEIDVARLLDRNSEPKATMVGFRLGLEAHIKFRLGLQLFIENAPLLKESELIEQNEFLGIAYHAYGVGVVGRW